jgi:O-acetylserine/cysteine efflux transporter
MPARDIALAVFIQVLWGPIYTLCKPALSWFPPLIMVAIVYIVVAALFTPFMPRPKTPARTLILMSLFGGALQTSMVFVALTYLPASTAVLVMQLQLPVAVVASWFIGRDKPSVKNSIGSLVCLAGVAIVVGMPEATDAWYGILAMLIGVVSWSVVQAMIPVIAKDQGMTLYTAMARYAAPQMIVAALVLEHDRLPELATVPVTGWLAVIGISLFGFALPYAIWYWLLMRHRVDELTPFLLLMPVFGVAVAALQLNEPLPPSLLLGGLVVILGLGLIVFPRRVPAGAEIPPPA